MSSGFEGSQSGLIVGSNPEAEQLVLIKVGVNLDCGDKV